VSSCIFGCQDWDSSQCDHWVGRKDSILQARVQVLSRTEQAAEYATLLEAAEQENVELQQELRLAQDLSSSLAAALHEAQNALKHEQATKSALVEQLTALGMSTAPHGDQDAGVRHKTGRKMWLFLKSIIDCRFYSI
jgi:hypothetical protein